MWYITWSGPLLPLRHPKTGAIGTGQGVMPK